MTPEERAAKIMKIVEYAIEWRKKGVSNIDEAPQIKIFNMIETAIREAVDENNYIHLNMCGHWHRVEDCENTDARVRAAAYEECAKICEQKGELVKDRSRLAFIEHASDAKAIRARAKEAI